jgi:hypothetical protein
MPESKEIKTGRPLGRPRKFAEGRYHATVRLTPQRYVDVKGTADAARRSVSEEIEARLERLSTYDNVLAAMNTSLERIRDGSLEAELFRGGYSAIRDAASGKKLWAEPGYPGVKHSYFVDESWQVHLLTTERVPRAPESDERERELQELEELRQLRRRVEEAMMPPAKPEGKVA